MLKKYSGVVVEDTRISSKTIHLRIKLPEPIPFKSGQFMMMYGQGINLKRAYSIASPPQWADFMDFLIEVKEGGQVSPHLVDLKKGSTVEMEGPFGKFILEQPLKKQTTFIATGTGLAPFRSMIHDLLLTNAKTQINLLYGFRFPDGFLMKEELLGLAAEHQNFRLIATCSRPDETWKGLSGRVTDYLKEISPMDNHVYLCGAPVMIEDTLKALQESGFPKEALHREVWG